MRDLANSINIDRTRVRDEALAQLDLLERKRNMLNEYQEELHTLTSGLNISIYSVNGKLAKLENVPDVIFGILDTDTVSASVLNERIYLLNELSKTIGKRSEDYADNVWRGANIRFLSNALRHDIDSNISKLTPLLTELENLHTSVCSKLGLEITPSLVGTEELANILSIASKSPMIPQEWVTSSNIDVLVDNARRYKELVSEIVRITNELNSNYSEEINCVDALKYKDDLSALVLNLQARLCYDSTNSLVLELDRIYRDIETVVINISRLFDSAKNLARN